MRSSVKYAPGLGGKVNGQIDNILRSWKREDAKKGKKK